MGMTLKEELAKMIREMQEEFASPNRPHSPYRLENRHLAGVCLRDSGVGPGTHEQAPRSRRIHHDHES